MKTKKLKFIIDVEFTGPKDKFDTADYPEYTHKRLKYLENWIKESLFTDLNKYCTGFDYLGCDKDRTFDIKKLKVEAQKPFVKDLIND